MKNIELKTMCTINGGTCTFWDGVGTVAVCAFGGFLGLGAAIWYGYNDCPTIIA